MEINAGEKIALIDTIALSFQHQQLQATLNEVEIQLQIGRTTASRSARDRAYVQEKYDRITELFKKQSIPRQDLDDVNNQLQNVSAAYTAAQQSLSQLAARKQQIEAQIGLMRKKINDAIVTAPIPGIVTETFFEKGEAVPSMSPIAEIINLDELEVKIYISETQLPSIKYGQQVDLRIDGLDRSYSGKIIWVSPKAEFTPKTIMTPDTRTSLVYAVKISVQNSDMILKHGMPVVVSL